MVIPAGAENPRGKVRNRRPCPDTATPVGASSPSSATTSRVALVPPVEPELPSLPDDPSADSLDAVEPPELSEPDETPELEPSELCSGGLWPGHPASATAKAAHETTAPVPRSPVASPPERSRIDIANHDGPHLRSLPVHGRSLGPACCAALERAARTSSRRAAPGSGRGRGEVRRGADPRRLNHGQRHVDPDLRAQVEPDLPRRKPVPAHPRLDAHREHGVAATGGVVCVSPRAHSHPAEIHSRSGAPQK